jgi:ribose transport system ATP-binding protein
MQTKPSSRLAMRGVHKRFGATQALKQVSFHVGPGEVHTLIGENGAGKSTLMKILSGVHAPDGGEILLEGQPFRPENPEHARRAGIAMIYQELNLAPDLSVMENITLGREPSRWGWRQIRHQASQARDALECLDHGDLPLDQPVGELSIAQQQIVEIARALLGHPRVLIMDEPTSSLTRVDVENLFAVINRLRATGVSVVYISHFLEECQQISDRYTVLRDGESVGSGDMKGADLQHIIRMMVGREMKDIYPSRQTTLGEPIFEIENLRGQDKPLSASWKIHRGEIYGIAGLVGAGRTETLRACFGLDPIKGGELRIGTRVSTQATPRKRLAQGMGLLSENRKEEGLLLNRDLADNLTLTHFKPFTKAGFISRGKQLDSAQHWIEKLHVKARGATQHVGELSGGNQQKIAIARLLHHQADILLLDEPTRGIDIGSKSQIYQLVAELAQQGKAIVFVSSYLPELLGVCDTIGVMSRGQIRACRPASQWTETELIEVAVGQDQAHDGAKASPQAPDPGNTL